MNDEPWKMALRKRRFQDVRINSFDDVGASVEEIVLSNGCINILVQDPVCGPSDYTDLPGAKNNSGSTWRVFSNYGRSRRGGLRASGSQVPLTPEARQRLLERRQQRAEDSRVRVEKKRLALEKYRIRQREVKRQRELLDRLQIENSPTKPGDGSDSPTGVIISSPHRKFKFQSFRGGRGKGNSVKRLSLEDASSPHGASVKSKSSLSSSGSSHTSKHETPNCSKSAKRICMDADVLGRIDQVIEDVAKNSTSSSVSVAAWEDEGLQEDNEGSQEDDSRTKIDPAEDSETFDLQEDSFSGDEVEVSSSSFESKRNIVDASSSTNSESTKSLRGSGGAESSRPVIADADSSTQSLERRSKRQVKRINYAELLEDDYEDESSSQAKGSKPKKSESVSISSASKLAQSESGTASGESVSEANEVSSSVCEANKPILFNDEGGSVGQKNLPLSQVGACDLNTHNLERSTPAAQTSDPSPKPYHVKNLFPSNPQNNSDSQQTPRLSGHLHPHMSVQFLTGQTVTPYHPGDQSESAPPNFLLNVASTKCDGDKLSPRTPDNSRETSHHKSGHSPPPAASTASLPTPVNWTVQKERTSNGKLILRKSPSGTSADQFVVSLEAPPVSHHSSTKLPHNLIPCPQGNFPSPSHDRLSSGMTSVSASLSQWGDSYGHLSSSHYTAKEATVHYRAGLPPEAHPHSQVKLPKCALPPLQPESQFSVPDSRAPISSCLVSVSRRDHLGPMLPPSLPLSQSLSLPQSQQSHIQLVASPMAPQTGKSVMQTAGPLPKGHPRMVGSESNIWHQIHSRLKVPYGREPHPGIPYPLTSGGVPVPVQSPCQPSPRMPQTPHNSSYSDPRSPPPAHQSKPTTGGVSDRNFYNTMYKAMGSHPLGATAGPKVMPSAIQSTQVQLSSATHRNSSLTSSGSGNHPYGYFPHAASASQLVGPRGHEVVPSSRQQTVLKKAAVKVSERPGQGGQMTHSGHSLHTSQVFPTDIPQIRPDAPHNKGPLAPAPEHARDRNVFTARGMPPLINMMDVINTSQNSCSVRKPPPKTKVTNAASSQNVHAVEHDSRAASGSQMLHNLAMSWPGVGVLLDVAQNPHPQHVAIVPNPPPPLVSISPYQNPQTVSVSASSNPQAVSGSPIWAAFSLRPPSASLLVDAQPVNRNQMAQPVSSASSPQTQIPPQTSKVPAPVKNIKQERQEIANQESDQPSSMLIPLRIHISDPSVSANSKPVTSDSLDNDRLVSTCTSHQASVGVASRPDQLHAGHRTSETSVTKSGSVLHGIEESVSHCTDEAVDSKARLFQLRERPTDVSSNSQPVSKCVSRQSASESYMCSAASATVTVSTSSQSTSTGAVTKTVPSGNKTVVTSHVTTPGSDMTAVTSHVISPFGNDMSSVERRHTSDRLKEAADSKYHLSRLLSQQRAANQSSNPPSTQESVSTQRSSQAVASSAIPTTIAASVTAAATSSSGPSPSPQAVTRVTMSLNQSYVARSSLSTRTLAMPGSDLGETSDSKAHLAQLLSLSKSSDQHGTPSERLSNHGVTGSVLSQVSVVTVASCSVSTVSESATRSDLLGSNLVTAVMTQSVPLVSESVATSVSTGSNSVTTVMARSVPKMTESVLGLASTVAAPSTSLGDPASGLSSSTKLSSVPLSPTRSSQSAFRHVTLSRNERCPNETSAHETPSSTESCTDETAAQILLSISTSTFAETTSLPGIVHSDNSTRLTTYKSGSSCGSGAGAQPLPGAVPLTFPASQKGMEVAGSASSVVTNKVLSSSSSQLSSLNLPPAGPRSGETCTQAQVAIVVEPPPPAAQYTAPRAPVKASPTLRKLWTPLEDSIFAWHTSDSAPDRSERLPAGHVTVNCPDDLCLPTTGVYTVSVTVADGCGQGLAVTTCGQDQSEELCIKQEPQTPVRTLNRREVIDLVDSDTDHEEDLPPGQDEVRDSLASGISDMAMDKVLGGVEESQAGSEGVFHERESPAVSDVEVVAVKEEAVVPAQPFVPDEVIEIDNSDSDDDQSDLHIKEKDGSIDRSSLQGFSQRVCVVEDLSEAEHLVRDTSVYSCDALPIQQPSEHSAVKDVSPAQELSDSPRHTAGSSVSVEKHSEVQRNMSEEIPSEGVSERQPERPMLDSVSTAVIAKKEHHLSDSSEGPVSHSSSQPSCMLPNHVGGPLNLTERQLEYIQNRLARVSQDVAAITAGGQPLTNSPSSRRLSTSSTGGLSSPLSIDNAATSLGLSRKSGANSLAALKNVKRERDEEDDSIYISEEDDVEEEEDEEANQSLSGASLSGSGTSTMESNVQKLLLALGSWSPADVREWLKKNKLDCVCPKLSSLDGNGLQRIAFEHFRDPDRFYTRIKKSLGLTVFQSLVVIRGLKSLLEDQS
ncbi:uncharacterized protein LOC101856669 [Aplysia californica]|uniref:Uncharacterized protein LOC101856669 n=1 Tax=Aplysia californica TaxID=6500 RepID=A0ABM0JTQ8_APLCA|nr:uncharacterized protein LOC101856669 [Aplysia californica]